MRSIIKIRNLSFKYGDKEIFNDIDLDIKENSITAIVMKNASGKTTLAKILAGLYDYSGYINVSNSLLNDKFLNRIRRNFSVYFDNIIPFDTVRDTLAFTLENLQYRKGEIKILIEEMAKKLNIESILDTNPANLTISEKAKVSLASYLIYKPKVVFIDDLFRNLNNQDKKVAYRLLKEYHKKYKMTIIYTTSNMEDTLYADYIAIIDKGIVVREGTPKEVYKDDSLEKEGFIYPFILRLSHNLMLYDLFDEVYLTSKEVCDKLWP